jgi:hypothetical protein
MTKLLFTFTILAALLVSTFAQGPFRDNIDGRPFRGDGDGNGGRPFQGDRDDRPFCDDDDGDRHPGPPGCGCFPPFLMGLVDNIKESVEFTDLGCTPQADEPVCSFDRDGEIGNWVCRTFYNMVTGEPLEPMSACIPLDRAIVGVDKCGCCDGSCPEPCACTCVRDDDTEGYLVTPTKKEPDNADDANDDANNDDNDRRNMGPRCLPKSMAMKMRGIGRLRQGQDTMTHAREAQTWHTTVALVCHSLFYL